MSIPMSLEAECSSKEQALNIKRASSQSKEQDLNIKRASFQSKEQRVLERQRWVFCARKPCGYNMVVKQEEEEEQHQQRKLLYKDLTSFKL